MYLACLQDTQNAPHSGNCESGGVWKQAKVTEDVEDLSVVAVFLSTHFGYRVDLVVAHSRGSNAAMHWCSTTDEGRKISAFVNVSGRYRMEVSLLLTIALTNNSSFCMTENGRSEN